jgi:alkylated DNA repair dioxygenase AlkB
MLTYLTPDSTIETFHLPDDIAFSEDETALLWDLRPDYPHKVIVFGKEHNTPRLVRSYGESYAFSGTVAHATVIPEMFNKLIEYFSKRYGREFNQFLVNWYRNGEDYIGFHSDDEQQLVDGTEIVGVSLGATRDFVLKHKTTKESTVVSADNNSVIVMGGACQRTHKHSVPKRLRVRGYRISLTLRAFV